jgi:hypothetical protein
MNLNIPGFTTPTLLEFHRKIRECLERDDANPAEQKVFGVRSFSDWRLLRDAMEKELSTRGVSFTPVTW